MERLSPAGPAGGHAAALGRLKKYGFLLNAGSASPMVLMGEVEHAVSDPDDELANADVISSGREDFGMFAGSRWPKLTRFVRSRWARIIAVPVLAGAVAAGALLATDSQPPSSPGPPAQQIVITSTANPASGVVMPGQWVSWSSGCRRGRSCPRG
jgi:hypothetical protein